MKRTVSVIILAVLMMTVIATAFAEHTHNWVTEECQAAACNRSGYARRRCVTCGASDYTEIRSTGHHLFDGTWVPVSSPTFCLEGSRKHRCEKCGEWFTETIPALTVTDAARHRAHLLFGYDKRRDDADAPGEKYVRNIQSYLLLWGYKLKVDGIFGEKTENAVKVFQMYHNIPQTGIVGEMTALELSCK